MKLSVILLFILCSNVLVAQLSKIALINKRTQNITVIDSAKGYFSETSLEFSTSSERNLIEIDYNGLDPIDELKLFKVVKKKSMIDFNYSISDIDIENEFFYLDTKYKLLECEPNSRFVVRYKQHSNELMYLCNILLNQAYEVDTFEYFIKVPVNYQLKYEKINTELLKKLTIDSTTQGDYLIYHILSQPKEPLNPYTAFKQNYSLVRNPMLRTIVTPKSYSGSESIYFRKWYSGLLKPVSNLSVESIKLIDSLTSPFVDKDSIISTLYSFVQRSVRYVGLYKGIGAFQPHDVNKVLLSQKGDCKDVANLLCQMLNYKGITSYLALTNIGNTSNSFDFPSLSSANHVVCAVKNDNSWLILDATDDFNKTGEPVLALQGRNLFIMSDNMHEYYRYPVLDSKYNKKSMIYNLKLSDNKFVGDFEITYHGLNVYSLKYFKSILSNKDFDLILRTHLENSSEEIEYKSINLNDSDNEFKISGISEADGNLMNKAGDKTYLLTGFMPFPLPQLIYRNSIDGDLFLENTINNFVEITLDIQVPIKNIHFKPVEYKGKNVFFKMNVSKLDQTKLKITYEFVINEIFINQSNIYEINQMLSLYNAQNAIIIE